MTRLLAAPLVVGILATASPSHADCVGPWPEVRDPSDVMAMLDDGRLYSAQAGRLDALAGRRQGVAARLLELRYAIGKTASASEQGDAGTDHDIEALRNQVETSEEQLQFIDNEIALLLQSFCLEE